MTKPDCCDTMRKFVNPSYGCVPTLENGYIVGCDDSFNASEGGEKIRFCPWCGKKIE